jgi:hypothetical protein
MNRFKKGGDGDGDGDFKLSEDVKMLMKYYKQQFLSGLLLFIFTLVHIVIFIFLYQKDQEIPCFLGLIMIHSLLFAYTFNLCLLYFKDNGEGTNYMKFIWASIMISMSIKFSALVIFSFVFTRLFRHLQTAINSGGSVKNVSQPLDLLPPYLFKTLHTYFKPIFISSSSAIIVMLLLITLIPTLTSKGVRLDYFYGLMGLLGLYAVGASCYEVFCSNLFLELNKRTPTSFA